MSHPQARRKQTARRSRPFVWPGSGSGRPATDVPEVVTNEPVRRTVQTARRARPFRGNGAGSGRGRAPSPLTDEDLPLPRPSSSNPRQDNARLPPLAPAGGPPLVVDEHIGGMLIVDPDADPRTAAVSTGFPVSVHPLRPPNARAGFSTASSTSIIDTRFVRLAGLLHKMVPLRAGVDDVRLQTNMGGTFEVVGRVDVRFDAKGYEFCIPCWVTDIGFPFEMILGNDWATKFAMTTSFRCGVFDVNIVEADAKKVRDLRDVYVTE